MSVSQITIEPHPLLELGLLAVEFPEALGEIPSPEWLRALLGIEADAALRSDDSVRTSVRELLRHGGYKPAGRGKPASEYLLRQARDHELASINVAVDACNAVSLHSGLPISVVDLDLVRAPLRIGIAGDGARYVFNPAGQEIRVGGLLCLHDESGPTANAVRDRQATKTHDGTRRTLSMVWGCKSLAEHTRAAVTWYGQLLERLGCHVSSEIRSG